MANNTLTLTDYQALAADTAIYKGRGTIGGLMYVGLGLGESGETQGKIKKIYRDTNAETVFDYPADKVAEIGKELGDQLWYIAMTAKELGLDLGDIAQGNLEKLSSRKERGVLTGNGDNR